MCNRVVSYYQMPIDPGFVAHMINDTGLSQRDRDIVWSVRKHTGDTTFYADLAGLPKKMFCSIFGNINRRMMDELFRLALIGWRTETQR